MDTPQSPREQTVMVITVAMAAVIGAISGLVSSFFMIGALGVTGVGSLGDDVSDEVMDSRIVELIEEESTTIAVVERVTPAVVSIVVKKPRSTVDSGYYLNSFFQIEALNEVDPDELVEISSGTGFFVSTDGYLLTNRHVVDEPDATFYVVTNDGDELHAELVDIDPFQDIAVLRVDGGDFPSVTLGDSDALRIGQTVIAIGNTLSEFRNTVTKGVVSGINRRVTAGNSYNAEVIDEAIQTDAAINPGNSGGPLINLLGEVIGINTAVSFEGEAVAFAIPINEAKRVVEDVKTFGRIVRPWLGVRYVLVTAEEEEDGSRAYEVGALIVSGEQPGEVGVIEGSPAYLAGLLEEDVILSVNEEYLSEDAALAELVSAYHPGDEVVIGVLRDGVTFTFNVTLAEYGETE
jgi:serine protease Do